MQSTSQHAGNFDFNSMQMMADENARSQHQSLQNQLMSKVGGFNTMSSVQGLLNARNERMFDNL